MKVTVDEERAEIVFGRALEAFHACIYPYDQMVLPGRPATLPPSLKVGTPEHQKIEHARFVFLACLYMRGGVKSDVAFNALSNFYETSPEFFAPGYVLVGDEVRAQQLRDELDRRRLGFNVRSVVKGWAENLAKLEKFWGGDPLRIIQGAEDYAEVCRRHIHPSGKTKGPENPNGFYGFREKMVSMQLYFLMAGGLTSEFTFPVPVDVQILRLLLAHRILAISKDDGSSVFEGVLDPEPLRPHGRDITHAYALKHRVSSLHLAEALWHLGRIACPDNPGNRSQMIGERDGRRTELQQAPLDWGSAAVLSFMRSCDRCPLQETCEINVPGRVNAITGKMPLWGRRPQPPSLSVQEGLPGIPRSFRKSRGAKPKSESTDKKKEDKEAVQESLFRE